MKKQIIFMVVLTIMIMLLSGCLEPMGSIRYTHMGTISKVEVSETYDKICFQDGKIIANILFSNVSWFDNNTGKQIYVEWEWDMDYHCSIIKEKRLLN